MLKINIRKKQPFLTNDFASLWWRNKFLIMFPPPPPCFSTARRKDFGLLRSMNYEMSRTIRRILSFAAWGG